MSLFQHERKRMLKVSDLNVDHKYQRPEDLKASRNIAKDFNPDAFGALIVGLREDGSYHVIDGQRRYGAALIRELDEVPCVVFQSKGRKHEAEIFNLVNNNRTNLSPVDSYKALLVQGHEQTLRINRVLKRHKFKVTKSPGWRNFRATKPLYEAYDAGTLDKVLDTISKSFEHHVKRMQTIGCHVLMVSTLDHILRKLDKTINHMRLVTILSEMTPATWTVLVERYAGHTGGRGPKVAKGFIEEHYNYRLKKANRIIWD